MPSFQLPPCTIKLMTNSDSHHYYNIGSPLMTVLYVFQHYINCTNITVAGKQLTLHYKTMPREFPASSFLFPKWGFPCIDCGLFSSWSKHELTMSCCGQTTRIRIHTNKQTSSNTLTNQLLLPENISTASQTVLRCDKIPKSCSVVKLQLV